MSQGLKRARNPFLGRNAITGGAILVFVTGVYWYSISAVKQDDFVSIQSIGFECYEGFSLARRLLIQSLVRLSYLLRPMFKIFFHRYPLEPISKPSKKNSLKRNFEVPNNTLLFPPLPLPHHPHHHHIITEVK